MSTTIVPGLSWVKYSTSARLVGSENSSDVASAIIAWSRGVNCGSGIEAHDRRATAQGRARRQSQRKEKGTHRHGRTKASVPGVEFTLATYGLIVR